MPSVSKNQAIIIEDDVIAGNYYDKYQTKNLIARKLMTNFLQNVSELVNESGAKKIHEIGCGEGHLTEVLCAKNREVLGTDFSKQVIAKANQHKNEIYKKVQFEVADAYQLSEKKHSAELIVCCEVLEHLETPWRVLDVIKKLAQPYVLFSVPREPIWRIMNMARLKYWGALGNTPGHLQHWSKSSFLNFIAERFDILTVRSPLPWTMALCRVKQEQ